MMAVIRFCLRASEQDRAGALRQLSSYMWEWPPENPLELGTLYVSEALRSKEKSGILAGPVENSASCSRPFQEHLALWRATALKVHSPEVPRRILQFQAKLPTRVPFMSAPDQERFAGAWLARLTSRTRSPTEKPRGTTTRHPFGLI